MSGEFIAACILYGPKALPSGLSDYFPNQMKAIWLMLMESAQRDPIVSMPFHPDMNEQDFRAATRLFLNAIRQERYDQTVSGRIDQLREHGTSDNEISNLLGLPRQTVNDHPRKK